MLDTDLAASLTAACSWDAHLLLVGDINQLPPVGHGSPLRDCIAAGVPAGEMTEIRRNAGAIVQVCHAIKNAQPWQPSLVWDADKVLGLKKLVPPTDDVAADGNLWHIEATDSKQAAAVVETLYLDAVATYGVEGVAVLTPTHKSEGIGRECLNPLLQVSFNACGEQAPPNPFRVGDPVICLRNHYALDARNAREQHYLANGEIGSVREVTERATVALFPLPDRLVCFRVGPRAGAGADDDPRSGRRLDFDLAYALTGHKSQGSEWPMVLVVADGSSRAFNVASREWLYTALSRASVLCITVGRLETLKVMARRPALVRRKTFLKEMIQGERTNTS